MHADERRFFWCVWRGSRVDSMCSHPGRHVGLVGVGGRVLSDEPWIAEPDRCTEPPFALGTGAVEFWNFDESRLGGR